MREFHWSTGILPVTQAGSLCSIFRCEFSTATLLLFKKKFIAPILAGEKTQTVRLWRRSRVRAGQRSYIPGVGYITIDAVDPILLDDLTDADARLDGFPDAASLREELHTLYAKELQLGFQAFRVRFTRLPEAEQLRIKAERKKQKELLQQEKNSKEHYEKTMKKLRTIAKLDSPE